MSDIAANFAQVQERIAAGCAAVDRDAEEVSLLAVSKYSPADAVRAALAIGHQAFGESRVQDLAAKAKELRAESQLQWHLIGSLQTNKVRDLVQVDRVALLHSLDRKKLAGQLQRELVAAGKTLDVLLQVNATGEESKHGCLPDAVSDLLEYVQTNCGALRVQGMMAMGPLQGSARAVFDRVASLRDRERQRSGLKLGTLSIGMSGDLEDAIAAGSTLLRVGTALFGGRS